MSQPTRKKLIEVALPLEDALVETERERLCDIIRKLLKCENSNDDRTLNKARAEILRSTGGNPPPVYDPFCGGGSIPLEAQRLGLEAHTGDLNPVPVLITKALIELQPRFAIKPPVNPESRKKLSAAGSWKGAAGLAGRPEPRSSSSLTTRKPVVAAVVSSKVPIAWFSPRLSKFQEMDERIMLWNDPIPFLVGDIVPSCTGTFTARRSLSSALSS